MSQSKVSGRLGNFSTRLMRSEDELAEAQRLRYQVFYEEMSAKANAQQAKAKRDFDPHDANCDHLLVLEETSVKANIVGTQRFFLKPGPNQNAVFHSQNEFDVEGLYQRHEGKTFMELGRSCIVAEHRTKRTMELMWHGTWAYALENRVDVMIGCASFQTRDVSEIAPALGLLHELASADEDWSTPATHVDAIKLSDLSKLTSDPKKTMRLLPPLLRGYLRLGAMFSDYAVPDTEFGTIDVLVIMPVEHLNPKYVRHYGSQAQRLR